MRRELQERDSSFPQLQRAAAAPAGMPACITATAECGKCCLKGIRAAPSRRQDQDRLWHNRLCVPMLLPIPLAA